MLQDGERGACGRAAVDPRFLYGMHALGRPGLGCRLCSPRGTAWVSWLVPPRGNVPVDLVTKAPLGSACLQKTWTPEQWAKNKAS
jgi:hypothetical protein